MHVSGFQIYYVLFTIINKRIFEDTRKTYLKLCGTKFHTRHVFLVHFHKQYRNHTRGTNANVHFENVKIFFLIIASLLLYLMTLYQLRRLRSINKK